MPRIIVDAGSSKTDWARLEPDGEIRMHQTGGFNPNNHDLEELHAYIDTIGVELGSLDSIRRIDYFGSGCGLQSNRIKVYDVLHSRFPQAIIVVDTDLYGAALALCQGNEGIACILGTGSNSCHFSGTKIMDQIPNLGFMLGDEGSGAYFGKSLVRAYFYRQAPDQVNQWILEYMPGGRDELLSRLQNPAGLNTWFAGFCKILIELPEDPYLYEILRNSLLKFVENHVIPYEGSDKIPIHFTGSIAHHFQHILEEILAEKGLIMGQIIQRPIQGLILYYQTNIDK